jgi:hypothetical protein
MCGLFFCPEKGSKGTDIVGMYDVKTRLKKYVKRRFHALCSRRERTRSVMMKRKKRKRAVNSMNGKALAKTKTMEPFLPRSRLLEYTCCSNQISQYRRTQLACLDAVDVERNIKIADIISRRAGRASPLFFCIQ